jgi:DNA-binding response OmpR family regulator
LKILVIEDEPELLKNISENLIRERYLVEAARTLDEAKIKLSDYDYSCILLDISLPDGSGFEILDLLHGFGKQQNVIIISALNALDDKIKGLELGADDYLTKPFHLAELNARIKAVLRRKNLSGQDIVGAGNLEIDYTEHTVKIDDKHISLNRKEFDILAFFLENKNRLVSKLSLASYVWGDNTDEADNLDFVYSQIKNLRKKLKEHGADVEIRAVYGIGYKFIIS